jgi:hypothetical protein
MNIICLKKRRKIYLKKCGALEFKHFKMKQIAFVMVVTLVIKRGMNLFSIFYHSKLKDFSHKRRCFKETY